MWFSFSYIFFTLFPDWKIWIGLLLPLISFSMLFSVDAGACPRSNYKLFTTTSVCVCVCTFLPHSASSPYAQSHVYIVKSLSSHKCRLTRSNNKLHTALITYAHTEVIFFSVFPFSSSLFLVSVSVTGARMNKKMLTMKSTKNRGTI